MCVGGKGEVIEKERVKPCRVKAKAFFIGTFCNRRQLLTFAHRGQPAFTAGIMEV